MSCPSLIPYQPDFHRRNDKRLLVLYHCPSCLHHTVEYFDCEIILIKFRKYSCPNCQYLRDNYPLPVQQIYAQMRFCWACGAENSLGYKNCFGKLKREDGTEAMCGMSLKEGSTVKWVREIYKVVYICGLYDVTGEEVDIETVEREWKARGVSEYQHKWTWVDRYSSPRELSGEGGEEDWNSLHWSENQEEEEEEEEEEEGEEYQESYEAPIRSRRSKWMRWFRRMLGRRE